MKIADEELLLLNKLIVIDQIVLRMKMHQKQLIATIHYRETISLLSACSVLFFATTVLR